MKSLLAELKINVGKILIYYDSKCTRSVNEDPENQLRVKHIDVKYFFVREQQEIGTNKMMQISTKGQIAHILTKPFSRRKFEKLRAMMGINIYKSNLSILPVVSKKIQKRLTCVDFFLPTFYLQKI